MLYILCWHTQQTSFIYVKKINNFRNNVQRRTTPFLNLTRFQILNIYTLEIIRCNITNFDQSRKEKLRRVYSFSIWAFYRVSFDNKKLKNIKISHFTVYFMILIVIGFQSYDDVPITFALQVSKQDCNIPLENTYENILKIK